MLFKKSGYRKQGNKGVNRITSFFSQTSTFIVPWRVVWVWVELLLKEWPLPEIFFVSEWPQTVQICSFLPAFPQSGSVIFIQGP